MQCAISFSVWGDNPKYVDGFRKNVELLPVIYRGWEIRLHYCKAMNIGPMDGVFYGNHIDSSWSNSRKMAERFITNSFDEVTIFRDSDSRLSWRERAAVEEWIASGKRFHFMCDHEHHRSYPIFGGMWGVRGHIPEMRQWINERTQWRDRLDDMELLKEKVWPIAQETDDYLAHSSQPNHLYWNPVNIRPFPTDIERGFVGQQYE